MRKVPPRVEALDHGSGVRPICMHTRMLISASQGDWIHVQKAEKAGGSVEAQTPRGITPLILAAAGGHAKCVKVLVQEMGANINHCDNDGYTALHYATICCEEYTIQRLLKLGADKTARTKSGLTARDVALV